MPHDPTTSPVAWTAQSYPEIVETAAADGSVLIVPVGSLEQHGHHLPVSTDTLLVEAAAHAGATRVRDDVPILVTPTVWSGRSPHHLPFGGTVSLDTSTLLDVLAEIVDTALENGFDAVLVLNGHGGNMSVVSDVVSEAGRRQPDNEILGLTYFHLAIDAVDEVRDSETGGVSHGGEMETSLMMHLHPELVDEDAIEGTMRDEPYDRARQDLLDDGPLAVYRSFDEYSDSGAIGAPDLATAAKGEAIFEAVEAELADLLREIHAENRKSA